MKMTKAIREIYISSAVQRDLFFGWQASMLYHSIYYLISHTGGSTIYQNSAFSQKHRHDEITHAVAETP